MNFQLKMSPQSNKFLLYCVIWVLTVITGAYFRLFPLLQHASYDSQEQALVNVVSKIKQQLFSTIEDEYPDIPIPEKIQLTNIRLNEVLKENKEDFWSSVAQVAKKLDAKKGVQSSFPYLLASDSFLYYGLTENIQNTGKISQKIKGSKYFNSYMLAPLGHWEPLNLHPYVGHFVHKIITIFNPAMPLMYSISFTPLVIMSLSVIPFLIICSYFSFQFLPTLTGALYFVLAPIFVKRSTFGWYDNDPYNTFFPLCILALLLFGLSRKLNKRNIAITGACLTFAMAVYALFWHGWVFLEGILLISGLLIYLYTRLINKNKDLAKGILTYFSVVIMGTFIGVSVIFGIKEFFILFQEGWTALQGFLRPELSIWPDLYIGVSELKRSSFSFIVEQVGGYSFLCVSFLGLVYLLWQTIYRKDTFLIHSAILIITFLIFSFIVTLGAERFVLLFLIPLSLLFPFGVQCIFSLIDLLLRTRINSEKNLRILAQGFYTFIALILVAPSLVSINNKMPFLLNQIYNDTWNKSLISIRDKTPPNSIINTWWPPGHFIKTIAKRRVTFDGATINMPQSYWLSNIFLSNSEVQALGMLRMLNNSANKATEFLRTAGFEISDAVSILKTITAVNKDKAKAFLRPKLSDEKINELLKLTHEKPPPSYFFIYNDFMDKNIQLSFIGNWDFKRIEKIRDNPSLRESIPSPGSDNYVDFLWTVSGKYPRQTGVLIPSKSNGNTILFDQGIQIDIENKNARILSGPYGKGKPKSILYIDDNQLIEKSFPDATLPYSILLFKKANKYNCILLDTALAKSLIFQMYYMDGKGFKYITPFTTEEDVSGRTKIVVYKVDWEKFYQDINS